MTGLHDATFIHVNVNCSDLDRSRAFYAEGLGLEPAVRTAPESVQPGDGFGLDRAQWDAWILLGARGWAGGAMDLLEWREPHPTGTPPASFVTTGYQRFGVTVTDLDAASARVGRLGGAVWSEVQSHTLPAGGAVRLVMANDPDGTAVELIEGQDPSVSFVAVGCADLERSAAWYGALGFRELARFAPSPGDGRHLRIDGPAAFDEVLLSPPGGGDTRLVLVGFRTPPVAPAAARPANALGVWRAAYGVDDLDRAVAELEARDIARLSPPVTMAMGSPLPELRFVCFRGPDAEVIELIERPR